MADPVWVQVVRLNPFHAPPPPPPPFLDILWKWINLVSMGNSKIMTPACMPRHARACLFLTLSLYMIMHVSINLFAVYTWTCMSNRLYVCMHVCVCVCTPARACVCVPCADPVFWPSGLDPHPLTKIPGSAHGSAWLSIYPSIENCPLIN